MNFVILNKFSQDYRNISGEICNFISINITTRSKQQFFQNIAKKKKLKTYFTFDKSFID